MDCLDLAKKTIKIRGIHFCYDRKLENQDNFLRHIQRIEKVLKLWRMKNLSLKGKIPMFKTLAISEITHLSLVTNDPMYIINKLNKIQN